MEDDTQADALFYPGTKQPMKLMWNDETVLRHAVFHLINNFFNLRRHASLFAVFGFNYGVVPRNRVVQVKKAHRLRRKVSRDRWGRANRHLRMILPLANP